ncbi:MAG: hypothetical protein ABI036_11770 [Fibrobacteria bacterium]
MPQPALYVGISAEGWQSNPYYSWLDVPRKLNPGNIQVAPPYGRRCGA